MSAKKSSRKPTHCPACSSRRPARADLICPACGRTLADAQRWCEAGIGKIYERAIKLLKLKGRA
jgi:ribosomal protein L37AE/L43A